MLLTSRDVWIKMGVNQLLVFAIDCITSPSPGLKYTKITFFIIGLAYKLANLDAKDPLADTQFLGGHLSTLMRDRLQYRKVRYESEADRGLNILNYLRDRKNRAGN